MSPRLEHEIAQLSQSLAASVRDLHAKSPTSPELVVAAAVDFLAACVSALHSPDGVIKESMLNVIQETLKDRIAYYDRMSPLAPGTKVH